MKLSNREKIDKLFQQAAEQSLDDLINEYESLEEPDEKYEFSDEHNKKMEKLFRKAKRVESRGNTDSWYRFRRLGFNLAAVVSILFTVLTLVAFTVPEIRVAITNYIIEHTEEHIVINTEASEYNGELIEGAPYYVPDGYKIIEYNETKIMLDIIYDNGEGGFIYFIRNTGETMLTIDNENNSFESIDINGFNGYINEKNNEHTLIFHDGSFTYHIRTSENKAELMKIAQSIIK